MNRVRRALRSLKEDRSSGRVIVSAAGSGLVAGTFPQLLLLVPGGNVTLAWVCCLGFAALGAGWTLSHSRSGVGIVIFQKPSASSSWPEDETLARAESAKSEHVGFFYVNVDALQPGVVGDARFQLARGVVQARLHELKESAASSVSFYLTSNQVDAFKLGAALVPVVGSGVLPRTGGPAILVHQVRRPTVSMGGHATRRITPPLPPLRFRVSNGAAIAEATSFPLASVIEREIHQFAASLGRPINHHALIVSIADNPDMRVQALGAAAVGGGDHYIGGSSIMCSSAVVFDCPHPPFPSDSAAYNALLAQIVEYWESYLARKSQENSSEAKGFLFLSGPVSLAFSLGGLMTPGRTEIVEQRRTGGA